MLSSAQMSLTGDDGLQLHTQKADSLCQKHTNSVHIISAGCCTVAILSVSLDSKVFVKKISNKGRCLSARNHEICHESTDRKKTQCVKNRLRNILHATEVIRDQA